MAAAVFPVLSLYSANLDWITFSQLLLPLLILPLTALILLLLFAAIYRNSDKACFVSVCFVALMWSYGLVVQPGQVHGGGAPPDSWVRVLLYQGMLLVFGVLAVAVFRSRRPWSTAATVVTILAVSILCVPILQIGWFRAANLSAARSVTPGNTGKTRSGAAMIRLAPDIYHIILDGYSRDDVLAKVYGVDNTPFLDALRSRGFRIMPESRSNYMQTIMSLTSMMNMTYLDQLPAPKTSAFLYREQLALFFQYSAVLGELQRRGYTCVRLLSDVEILNGGAGIELRPPRVMFDLTRIDLYGTLIRSTPLRVFPIDTWLAAPSQPLVRFQFEALQQPMPAVKGPLFVFAHILSPHPPFIFDRNGNTPPGPLQRSVADGSDFPGSVQEYRRGYAEQVSFVNKQVLKAVDFILSRYPLYRRPVIIIQGDHGGGLGYHEEKLEETLLWERAGILNAYLLPSAVHFDLYDKITPINTYRVILDGLFGLDFKRLPDRTYYAPFSRPFDQTLIPEEKLVPPRE